MCPVQKTAWTFTQHNHLLSIYLNQTKHNVRPQLWQPHCCRQRNTCQESHTPTQIASFGGQTCSRNVPVLPAAIANRALCSLCFPVPLTFISHVSNLLCDDGYKQQRSALTYSWQIYKAWFYVTFTDAKMPKICKAACSLDGRSELIRVWLGRHLLFVTEGQLYQSIFKLKENERNSPI